MEANTFGLSELNLMETKKIEGGLVAPPQLDFCGLNRWAHNIAVENKDQDSAWRLDKWYDSHLCW
jgi:hypothetical protein